MSKVENDEQVLMDIFHELLSNRKRAPLPYSHNDEILGLTKKFTAIVQVRELSQCSTSSNGSEKQEPFTTGN